MVNGAILRMQNDGPRGRKARASKAILKRRSPSANHASVKTANNFKDPKAPPPRGHSATNVRRPKSKPDVKKTGANPLRKGVANKPRIVG